tara:strand:- start:36 stop:1106 length:1071 start_codon:yes stop_codon:yes gene_type:complete
MLYLYPESVEKKKALHKHVLSVTCLVYKRLTGKNCHNSICKVCKETGKKVNHELPEKVMNYLTREKVKEIIESKPQELWNNLEPFYRLISTHNANDFKIYITSLQKNKSDRTQLETEVFNRISSINKKIEKVFSYDTLSKKDKSYNLYLLATNLNQSTCTYCNRLYTNTIVSEKRDGRILKLSRPQFDHWFPNTRFPLLSVSFFNLIPSCTICNSSLKSDELFQIDTHYHPYINNISNGELTFSYGYDKKSSNGLKITLDTSNDSMKKVIDIFKVEEAYNAHTDELRDLLKLKQLYSDRYLNILANKTYSDLKISKEELYRLAFGAYFEDIDFRKRPFSRFKKDILKELEIIPKSN